MAHPRLMSLSRLVRSYLLWPWIFTVCLTHANLCANVQIKSHGDDLLSFRQLRGKGVVVTEIEDEDALVRHTTLEQALLPAPPYATLFFAGASSVCIV